MQTWLFLTKTSSIQTDGQISLSLIFATICQTLLLPNAFSKTLWLFSPRPVNFNLTRKILWSNTLTSNTSKPCSLVYTERWNLSLSFFDKNSHSFFVSCFFIISASQLKTSDRKSRTCCFSSLDEPLKSSASDLINETYRTSNWFFSYC